MTATPLTPEALRAAVAALGFELVDAELSGSAARRVVKLRIDRQGGSTPGNGVTSDDCQFVSRAIERQLEESGAVGSVWHLEVSSPGIERPIRFADHWRRFIGREVRVKVKGVPGARVGTVRAVPDDGRVTLQLKDEEVTIALDSIREATLVVDWSALGKPVAGD